MPLLTREKRRTVCIHEAAHAVVAALGGSLVYSVEVAPEGWTNWVTQGKKRGELTGLWGVCRTSDLGISLLALRWNANDCSYRVDRQVLSAYMKALEQAGEEVPAEARRAIRAYVCQSLAGPLAEMISENETAPFLEPNEHSPHDDATLAEACCWMLPSRSEWDHLHDVTENVLREYWVFVVKLADALEAAGRLDEAIENYLPSRIKNWPPAPKSAHKGLVDGR